MFSFGGVGATPDDLARLGQADFNVNLYPGDGVKEGAKETSMWNPESSLSFCAPTAPNVAFMVATPAVRNLMREGKVSQLYALLQTGQSVGMQTLDQSLLRLFHNQEISLQTLERLRKYPQNPKLMDNHGLDD